VVERRVSPEACCPGRCCSTLSVTTVRCVLQGPLTDLWCAAGGKGGGWVEAGAGWLEWMGLVAAGREDKTESIFGFHTLLVNDLQLFRNSMRRMVCEDRAGCWHVNGALRPVSLSLMSCTRVLCMCACFCVLLCRRPTILRAHTRTNTHTHTICREADHSPADESCV
jgi:hypothetical protein